MIRALARCAIGLGAYLVASQALAQGTCHFWGASAYGWKTSLAAACSAKAAYCSGPSMAINCGIGFGGTTVAVSVAGTGPGSNECKITAPGWGVPPGVGQLSTYVSEKDDTCPPPPACSNSAADGVGDQFTSSHFPGANGYCHALSHCKMTVTPSIAVDGTTLYTVKHTSQPCAHGAVPAPVGDQAKDGETCTGSAPEVCLSPQGENCGYVNDSFVCLPKIDDDGCAVAGDGGRVCGSKAPTPPAPDNGTAGQVATPDERITSTINSASNVYNYFNSTTVAASSRPPGTSGDNPYDGEDDGSGAGGGSSGGGEGGECPEGATCDGSLPDAGEFEEVCTVQECTQAFFNRVKAAPLFAGVLGVGASIPAGACPTWNVEIFDDSFSLSAPMCDVWENIAPLLSAAFLFIWGWIATRIVLSA